MEVNEKNEKKKSLKNKKWFWWGNIQSGKSWDLC